MKNELVTFDGGINTLVAPHLIPMNEARYISNTKIVSGQIEAEREPQPKNIPVAQALQDGSTATCVLGKSTIYFKGKDKVVSSGLLTGGVFSDEDRSYVEWAGFLYWSNYIGDGTGKLQRWDGDETHPVVDLGGHTPPTTDPVLTEDGSGLLNGEYSYCYTVTYEDVFESAPSDIVKLAPVVNKAIKISGLPTSGFDPIPTHITIYRSGGLNPTFNKVNRIEFGVSEYKDNTADFKISRKELNTGTNDAPPADIDMLIESKGTLFGAVGDKIHFSREGQPEYWSDYNYVQLPTKCSGLGKLGDTIIAFTEEDMYAIYGRNIKDITIEKLQHHYGCTNKKTIVNLKGTLLWATKQDTDDLICSFTGGTVNIVNRTNLTALSTRVGAFDYNFFATETYANFAFPPLSAVASGRRYVLFLEGRTVIVDLEGYPKTYYMQESVQGGFELHNELVVCKLGAANSGLDAFQYIESYAPRRNLSYVSRDFSDGSIITEKSYRKIHVNGKGHWGITIHVDGVSKFSFDYTNGNSIYLPSGTHGKVISFSISSVGFALVKAIQYEYEILESGYNTV